MLASPKVNSMGLIPLLLTLSTAGTTLAINPFLAFDPINIIKSSFLCAFTLSIVFLLWRSILQLLVVEKFVAFLIFFIFLSGIFTFVVHVREQGGWARMFWGTWGRSTGLLTWLMLLTLSLCLVVIIKNSLIDMNFFWKVFLRTSYFVSFYALLQIGKLDPISWSNDSAVSTLGNINFLSAFLGLVNVYLIAQIFDKMLTSLTRSYFLLLLMFYSWLILHTQSIQGIAMTATGATIIIFLRLLDSCGQKIAIMILIPISVLGVITLLGTMGIGPAGGRLVQQSVLFRLDYWTSALNMLRSNLWIGIGFDNYGDYYREFRTLIAAERTGPQRVSDTAHNVFLDLFTGGGILTGLPFLILVFYSSYRILVIAIRYKTSETYALAALMPSWIVFMSISINQIGVAVWGFSFLGVTVAHFSMNKDMHKLRGDFRKRGEKTAGPNDAKQGLMSRGMYRQVIGFHKGVKYVKASMGLLIGLLFTLPPNLADASFKAGLKKNDFVVMEKSVFQLGGTDVHLKTLINVLETKGSSKETLRLARKGIEKFPRDFSSWVSIALNSEARKDERLEAAQVLVHLDPKNSYLRDDLMNRVGP